MGRTFIRQDVQIASSLTTDPVAGGFKDNVAPTLASYETNATDLLHDLNCIRSQLQNFLNRSGAGFPGGKWYNDIPQPSTLEGGACRGIATLNQDLHDLEHKRVIRDVVLTADVTVPAAVRATGTLSGTGANFAAADTVKIDDVAGVTYKTYTFTSPLGANPGDVLLGANLNDSLVNLKAAINLETPVGGRYNAGTTAPLLVTCTASTATTLSLRAIAYGTQGNLIRTLSSVADPGFLAVKLSGGTGDLVVLGALELPSVTTAAVGNVTTLGTVVAYNATFEKATLDMVGGTTNVTPKNLCNVVDYLTRDPILLLDGRRVYALLQSEKATNPHTITAVTPDRVQLVFVVLDALGDNLELVKGTEMGGKQIMYTYEERTYLLNLNEEDFLRGAAVDIGAGAITPTRQNSYDNQGATPVEVGGTATLDLNSAGISWIIRDLLNANLLKITENTGTNASTLEVAAAVDYFDVNAVDNNFVAGLQVRTGGARQINVGVNDGIVETTAGALEVQAKTTLSLDDGNKPGGWSLAEGVHLSDSGAEWTAFEAAFGGEYSLLKCITDAFTKQKRTKVQSVLTANVVATNDVNGPGTPHNNCTVDLPPTDAVPTSFVQNVEVYLNGELLRNAAATGSEDVCQGGHPAAGDLQFMFALRGVGAKPDQLTVIVNGQ